MRRLFRFWSSLNSQHRANLVAGGIALAAVGFLRLEAAPTPAGSEVPMALAHKAPAFHLDLNTAPIATSISAAETPAGTGAATVSAAEVARQTLERKLESLKTGIAFLQKTPDYTAQFVKQEMVGSELTEEQEILMKVRHEPFSIYLKWITGERGREVLYVDQENDGEMLVRSGGWKAKLGTMSIPPDGGLAMREARYPVTKAGLLELAIQIQQYHEQDLATSNFTRCDQLADQKFDGRDCSCFLVEYKDAAGSPLYRKSITLIDKEWSIPVYIKNFAWPTPDQAAAQGDELDLATLIEYYSYSEIRFRQQFANSEFDRNNEEYRLQ